MKIFTKSKIFLLLVFIMSILYIVDVHLLWEFNSVPYNQDRLIGDFRYLQYIAELFPYANSSAEILFNIRNPDTISYFSNAVINYPRIWIYLLHYLNVLNTNLLFFYFYIILFFYILAYIKFIKKFNHWFMVYFFFSGSSLWLIERGNIDILIFVLIFYFFFSKIYIIRYLTYLLVAFFKFYPAFTLAYFLNGKLKSLIIILILGLIFTLYVYITKEDILLIKKYNPKSGDSGYGLLNILFNIKKHLSLIINYSYFQILNIFILIGGYALLKKKNLLNFKMQHRQLFLVGSGIFISTFMMDTHHDYRLIFIFFCLPAIIKLDKLSYKLVTLTSIFLSLELHRLMDIFGFYGGVINLSAKLLLFYIIGLMFIKNLNDIILIFKRKNFNL